MTNLLKPAMLEKYKIQLCKTLGGYFKRYPLGALRSRNKGGIMTQRISREEMKENFRKQQMLQRARLKRKYKIKKYIERINAERRSKGY